MPRVDLGTWCLRGVEGEAVVISAISAGYRSVDTASQYDNEEAVGRAIHRSRVAREEMFVTTKLWNTEHAYNRALRAFDASLSGLGLQYIDLYLVHWPVFRQDRYVEAWRALEKLYTDDRVRAIGVSNFTVQALGRLIDETGVVPAVNQIELHPGFPQSDLRAFHDEHGIATEAWKLLGRGEELLKNPRLRAVAEKHGRTPAQIVIRWHIQLGNLVIPKSATQSRIAENAAVFDFTLEDSDMSETGLLNSGERLDEDPETV
ncbi:aldo/keto reductase [Streptomyces parvulus]|uniref:aldo/keto reductase n=1 Tax=Streptomyces parvulus TaxID=146923 RepID=UPI003F4D1954